MKYLVLLNRKFPYRSGEAFLESEIGELASVFDKVIIYPSDPSHGERATREIVHSNVEVRALEHVNLKVRKICYAINGITKIRECTSGITPAEKVYEGYFLSAASYQAAKIIKDLSEMPFTDDDEIYLYSYWFYVTAKAGAILKKYFSDRGIKAVAFTRAHRFDIYEENRKLRFLPQRNEIFKAIDHVYACSDDGAAYLREHYPEYSSKISASYLGTYDHGMGIVEERNKFAIVSCSRITKVKRVHLIIEALKLLKDSGIELEWTHLGGGPLYKEIYQEAGRSLGWMKTNFPGNILNTEVYNYYQTNPVHLFINVSQSEGLPVSIMEAISFGIPVVATDVGGTSEIVVEGISGSLLEPSFKAEELAALIMKYKSMDSETYECLRNSTRKLWERQYQAVVNYAGFAGEILKLESLERGI